MSSERKRILIDALYINMGGGRILLDYLVRCLLESGVDFTLLKDERCAGLTEQDRIADVVEMQPRLKLRKAYYRKHRNDFSSVLCFANIPAPVRMPCPVYTYFHNVNLLKIPADYPLKRKVIVWIKRRFIARLAKNTACWIVQTPNTEAFLREALPCKGKRILQLPFFHIPAALKSAGQKNNNRTDYILVGDHTGTRGHAELVEAWRILSGKGLNAVLHLTVSEDNPFSVVIEDARRQGIPIVNHGIVPFEELARLYGKCKATVYPSINESLGLGLIEAIEAGCDVIAADLPYTHAVCRPSVVFPRRTPEEIANAVLFYEKEETNGSKLTIDNKIEELVFLLCGRGQG